jgi:uncharacterized FAD-dependent dehydrogenase
MIRINQLKMHTDHTETELINKICSVLKIQPQDLCSYEIIRRSTDARKKPEIYFIYLVDVKVRDEDRILKKLSGKNIKEQIAKAEPVSYSFPQSGDRKSKHRPVVVGMGPAGLFCGYYLAMSGYCPIILERGKSVDERQKDVNKFWEMGVLDTASNVQFGEGGAGTFSDGKLNTLVKDKYGRNRAVLETFVKYGADSSILYDAKPHIGTDVLSDVVRKMREAIIDMGGEVHFESQVTDIHIEDGRISAVIINDEKRLDTDILVLAPGHSARDTFYMLYGHGIPMEAKPFAVGFRVQHPQKLINMSQYGSYENDILGAAPYKVTAKTKSGRGVYSFCMCPGGYVVNASSEDGHTAVNGMSYSKRDGENANSAIIVSVSPKDYSGDGPLSGVEFQRELEKKAYTAGKGKIPVQRYGDFAGHFGESCGTGTGMKFTPQCKGQYEWTDLTDILPDECSRAFIEGMSVFGRQIKGFDAPETILAAVESRTSSPVRLTRNDMLESEVGGLYPCGEGAGYAGGITSAAMDGIRVAETIAAEFAPVKEHGA